MLAWLKARFPRHPAPQVPATPEGKAVVKQLPAPLPEPSAPPAASFGPKTLTKAERKARRRTLRRVTVAASWGHLLRRLEYEEAASPHPRKFVWSAGLNLEEGQALCGLANNHGFVAHASPEGRVTVLLHKALFLGSAGPVQREVAKILQANLPEGDWLMDRDQELILARKPPFGSLAMATFREGVMTSLLMIPSEADLPMWEGLDFLFFTVQDLTTPSDRAYAVLKLALLWQALEARS
jgi:hypothetical protein